MADDVARLVAVLEANVKGFTKGMEQAQRVADRQLGRVQRQMAATERRFAGGSVALTSLIRRYAAWGVVLGTLDRAMRTAAQTNYEAKQATVELGRAWDAFAENAAIVLSPLLTGTAKLLQNIAAINKELLAGNTSGAFRRFQELTSVQPNEAQVRQFERMGLIPKGTLPRSLESVTVTPSKIGDAKQPTPRASGETEAQKRAREKAEIEKQIAQDAFNIQQHFLEQEVDALRNATDIEAEIRQHYFDVQQQLWETEAAELADFHARAKAAWHEYYERQADMAEEAYDIRLTAAQQFFGELASLSRSSSAELAAIGKAAAIVTATIDGILAVQKALASAPPPYNFALAAAVGAAAAANVAEIAAMEHGGRVQAGQPVIVGEKRPELFVPDTAGTILPRVPTIPNARSPSGPSGGTLINIDARGAQRGVGEEIAIALQRAYPSWSAATIRQVEIRLPRLMTKAQRDSL